MDRILEHLTQWLKGFVVDALMNLLTGMFQSINTQVGSISKDLSVTPAKFEPEVYKMITKLSDNVIIPIAGIILTFIACYELIQMITAYNNLANFETFIFFKWIFKTYVAVMMITNCNKFTMAIFDVARYVIKKSGKIITHSTAINDKALATMRDTLMDTNFGSLLTIFCEIQLIHIGVILMEVYRGWLGKQKRKNVLILCWRR